MRTKRALAVGVVPIVAAAAWLALHPPGARPPPEPVVVSADAGAPAAPDAAGEAKMDPTDDSHDDERSYVFRIPSGEPTALSCEEARTIVEQVRAGLAYTPEGVSVGTFATSAADWLDPHGLLTLAKDAPTARAIAKAAPELIADIEGKRRRSCESALAPGAILEQWSNELRDAFDRGRQSPGSLDVKVASLEPLPPTGVAREVALEIGRRVGAFEAVHGAEGKAFADEARRRFFPQLDRAGWAKVVLASAVRAYVPLVDPHGEWAPFDEESRIYEVDLASRPPSRLWGRAVPTAIGVRVTDGAATPLAVDDVVLSVSRVATAGLPLEQVDQLGFATSDAKTPLSAVVLRAGKILTIELGKSDDAGAPAHPVAELPNERIAFGDGDVLIVEIKDVRDDLGDELATLIATERERGARKLSGVVLDLRGNGGGSTDGALGALSLFLPGAPLFAMKRRDGTIEIDRAPVPRERDLWSGPVATFVDGTTASAAEMIAGALATYKRGPTLGSATFGKGCAQEYVDDDAHAGVLRLTTLVYALPDGTPVQRVGLVPQIRFPFAAHGDSASNEREAKLPHSAPAWRGPDLREPGATKTTETPWPTHGGSVGPCHDGEVCRALRLLGGPKRAPVAKH
jgi:carboxyl-terminal processing protease